MKIYNYTGRAINIYNREDTLIRKDRLYLRSDLCSPKYVIASNCAINDLPQVYSEVYDAWVGRLQIPVQQFIDAQPIEEFCEGFDFKSDLIIAPNIWTQVVRSRGLVPAYTQLATVYSLVYDNTGKTVGCLGLEYK